MIQHVIDKIRKGMKSYKRVFICTILAFLLALFCQYQKSAVVQRNNQTMLEMNSIREMPSNVENQKAYLYIQDIPYLFSFLDEFNHGYYFVYDETNVYIAYMNEKDFEELNRDDLYHSSIKIKGITRKIPEGLKQIAMDSYNNSFNYLLDGIIPVEDFDEYFGEVYLDMTIEQKESIIDDTVLTRLPSLLFIFFISLGIFGLGLTIWKFFSLEHQRTYNPY